MYLVMFVLDDPEKVHDLLNAWEEAGVHGATVLHSTGLGRIRRQTGYRDDMPLIPSLESLMEHEESFSRTIFTVVQSDEMVDRVVEATQALIGDLSQPNTGFLVVLPVAKAYGLNKNGTSYSP